ncbi:PIR protein [Plasmodium yoelii]|uniref:YIR protein n=1 Tax=Plasmodium yoelii TaxID=5861 RepID=A0A077W5R4_PLAYE|nr:PIR protein [Plasmodium yoelii]CDS45024.1 YIR protein [Plasmodium yoelii]VTZ78668.1 PIR protein [Plasmodium yoelii]|eukprot:XP_022811058.1 PIR protein [Plasmodium yoelii]
MNDSVCKTFAPLRNVITNSDNVVSYRFTDDVDFKNHCTNGNCDNDTDKVNARCLYIFDEFFKNKSAFETEAKGNIYIVQYILIWLSYVLSLIESNQDDNRKHFYNTYINAGGKYTNNIDYIVGYKGYKDLIDRNNYILSMDKNIISKLYDAFSTLCDICIGVNGENSNCDNSLEKANQFVETYKKIIIDHNIGENIRYFYVLINLLTDYDNLKKNCDIFPPIPDITKIISEQHVCEVASSSSSIASKLIPILSILVAIPIFLGIAYKYSLFGFRKRGQKQHLRENLKK